MAERSHIRDAGAVTEGSAADPGGADRQHATPADEMRVLRPSQGWLAVDVRELWRHRELIAFLSWRDISVRYKQTFLGVLWALLQPLLLMLVFTLVFGIVARIPSQGLPYPLFAYAGLLPWQLFAFALTEASNSIVANERLITKVYFPRLVIPLSAVIAGLVDFAVSLGLYVALALYYRTPPGPAIVALPIFVLTAFAASLGVGLWLAALNVRYRDVRYTLPFLTQIWLFATPIAYPSTVVPEPIRTALGLNPMAGVVEGFRWALLGTSAPDVTLLALSMIVSLGLLLSGAAYFGRMERKFADII